MENGSNNGSKNNPEHEKINDKFFEDLGRIIKESTEGKNFESNLELLRRASISLDAEVIIHEGKPTARSLDTIRIALLHTKVKVLECMLLLLYNHEI